ncbi:MAG: ATP-binding cassette domain-containing protein [Bacteroidetes bacterium]|nr:ATP-binding cassette domain-containing protein [Bacteroidota bacterium]
MLEIKNLYKSFGKHHIINGITITFKQGHIYTIIGGNGAGKTTLFNIITGFLRPDKGEISFNNESINRSSPVSINLKGITRTFQDLRIINQLTVKENILLSFKNNPGEKIWNAILPDCIFRKQYNKLAQKANEIIDKIHLKEVVNNKAGEISYGQQKLLTIGCCLANDAKLLLLDEPIAGIDRDNYIRISKLIKELKNEGKTILQIEHNHNFIKELSDKIWFLNEGKAFLFESFAAFINDKKVIEFYLNKC